MLRTNQKVWTRSCAILTLAAILGCVESIHTDQASLVRARSAESVDVSNPTVDLGVVEEDFVADFDVSSAKGKQVSDIRLGCGCQAISLSKGDMIDDDTVMKMSVALAGKAVGKGRQSAVLTFDDGTEVVYTAKYRYFPKPFCQPSRLIFRPDRRSVKLRLTFPGEQDIEVTPPSSMEGFKFTVAGEEQPEIAIRDEIVEIDIAAEGGISEGAFVIATSSARRPQFHIPFLVLKN